MSNRSNPEASTFSQSSGVEVKDERAAHGAMLLFIFFVSTSFPVGSAITHALDPSALTFLRFVIASGAFGMLLFVKKQWQWPGPLLLLKYFWLGFLLVVFFITMFEGLRWGSPVNLGAVFTLIPMMTAIIAFFLLGQRTSIRLWVGLIIAALGAIWIVFGGSIENVLNFSLGKGELIFLIGCFSYSAYSPFVRKYHGGENLLVLTFWTLIAGMILLGVYGFEGIQSGPWLELDWFIYAAIFYLALCNTALSFYLLKFASFRLPAAKVMAYTFLTPAIVLVIQSVVYGVMPDIKLIIGVIIIASAMIFLQRSTDRSPKLRG
ncbi:DMT family transporter [Kiloniella sp. EL199]|uniref:DMT family transporter n=1 Tax=Kiloniella sp. EL199 TaxID=2107581 RepID=UPI000EA14CFE|nr:DMT family transporter [Kiloniella sp. EL199]